MEDEQNRNKESKNRYDTLANYGNEPGTPMHDYFLDKLPQGVTNITGESCMFYAKLILTDLQKTGEKAKVYWVKEDESVDGHAVVVPDSLNDEEYALSNDPGPPHFKSFTAGEARKDGEDITDEVESEPWERL